MLAKDIAALKAVSQNLMHSNLSITDGVYGILSEMDVRGRITGLCSNVGLGKIDKIDEIVKLTKKLLEEIEGVQEKNA
jgi:hypothetical protein